MKLCYFNISRLSLFFIIFLFSFKSYSKEEDFRLWTSVTAKTKIFKSIEFSIEEQFRLQNNATQIDQFFTDVGLGYDIFSFFELSGYYRFDNVNEDYGLKTHHKFFTDITLQQSVRRFSLSLRARYQTKYVDLINEEEGYLLKDYLRNKISVKYDHRKLPVSLKFANEWFCQVNKYTGYFYDKVRVEFGLAYNINPDNSIDLSYKIDTEFNVPNPNRNYILQFSYGRKI